MGPNLFGLKLWSKQILINAVLAAIILGLFVPLINSNYLEYYQKTFNSLFFKDLSNVTFSSPTLIIQNLIGQAFFMVIIINNFKGSFSFMIPIVMMLIYWAVVRSIYGLGLALDMFYSFLYGWILYIIAVAYNLISFDSQKKRIKQSFEHYLDARYVDQIADNPKKLKLGGEAKILTVLFSDIRGFSTISEKMSPTQLVEFLNEYLTAMTNIVMNNQGVVDKYIGDAVMTFWGAPLEDTNHPYHAVLTAWQMQQKLYELNIGWRQKSLPEIRIGIGINTDEMVVGNMGSDKRFNYTLMGDGVNLASRLEGLTKYYGTPIIISQNTYQAVMDKFSCRMLDKVAVKGKNQGVTIYEVLGTADEAEENRDLIAQTESALKSYFNQDFDQSIKQWQRLQSLDKNKLLADLFIQRCQEFQKSPPGKDWDGVYQMHEK